MKLKILLPVLAGAAAGAIVAVAIAGGGGSSTRTVTTVTSSDAAGSAAVPTSINKSQGLTINQIYRKTSPGVVDITVVSQEQTPGFGFFGGGSQKTEGEGAGVVYDKKGDILTDQHVVANATSVEVHFQNGVNAPAKVLGTDASTDMAVIHVNVPASQLHPIAFANSDAAQVGDPVVAIGSPFAQPWTVTSGIVSAVGRSIPAPNKFTISRAIQTDAPINPGNSGGPLLDAAGQVLGLNDQIDTGSGAEQSSGVGFATPGNTDQQVANTIISGKQVKHAYVGVCLNPTPSGGAQIATRPGVNCPTPIAPGSPAAKAGLKPGDTITAIDGKPVSSTNGFIETIAGSYAPGQTVTLTVKRSGSTQHIKVTLANRPASAPTG